MNRRARHRLGPVLTLVDVLLAVRDHAADTIWGPRCAYGCGQRLHPHEAHLHYRLDHAGDRP